MTDHLFRHENRWYNFCLKCAYLKDGVHKCKFNFDYKMTLHKHKFSDEYDTYCRKCKGSFLHSYTFTKDNQVFVCYTEEIKDRKISRYYCSNFYPQKTGEMIIPCSVSDDDYLVMEIIT